MKNTAGKFARNDPTAVEVDILTNFGWLVSTFDQPGNTNNIHN